MRWSTAGLVLLGVSASAPAWADPSTQTSTAGMSAAELELARHLTLLENLEVLEDLEMLELLPVLEEPDE